MSEGQPTYSSGRGRGYEIFPPLMLIIVAVTAWFAFQTLQLVKEHYTLADLKAGQESTLQKAHRMRSQLNAIASGVARLAKQGNTDAKQVVDALRSRGIVLHSDGDNSPQPHQ